MTWTTILIASALSPIMIIVGYAIIFGVEELQIFLNHAAGAVVFMSFLYAVPSAMIWLILAALGGIALADQDTVSRLNFVAVSAIGAAAGVAITMEMWKNFMDGFTGGSPDFGGQGVLVLVSTVLIVAGVAYFVWGKKNQHKMDEPE